MPKSDAEPAGEVAEADELYGLDPTEFVAARNGLVKRLKAEGRKADAEAVGALRRPSATAGALNRAAREHPALVEAALEAGAHLQQATGSGDAAGVRAATAAEREAKNALVRAAVERLGSGTADARSVIAATVHAAQLDGEVADQLRRGTLSTDHRRSGLGADADLDLSAWAVPAKPEPKPNPKAKPTKRHLESVPDLDDDDDAAEREAAAEAARIAAEEEARRAAAAEEHRRLLADLTAAAQDARAAAEQAEAAATEAEAEAVRLRTEAAAAAAAAEEAEGALVDARRAGPAPT